MDKYLVWIWNDRGKLVGLERFSSQEAAVECYKLIDKLLYESGGWYDHPFRSLQIVLSELPDFTEFGYAIRPTGTDMVVMGEDTYILLKKRFNGELTKREGRKYRKIKRMMERKRRSALKKRNKS